MKDREEMEVMTKCNEGLRSGKAGNSIRAACASMAVVLLCAASAGCLKFGDDEETTAPSADQVARCRAEMYLTPGLKIRPLGYKLIGSGIDDAIWFKFGTDTSSAAEIFRTDIVDVSGFGEALEIQAPASKSDWWDIAGKKIHGGRVSLPNARFMSVGIASSEGQSVVYIMWHET